jgi:hypothetical protein
LSTYITRSSDFVNESSGTFADRIMRAEPPPPGA